MANFKDVERAAKVAGLEVRTYSPGDGVTRYKFFKAEGMRPSQSYFGANGIHTALGAKAAIAFATSCQEGEEANVRYKIVRYYQHRSRNRTIHANVTLQVAQLHCNDKRTRKEGVYFDGYERM